MKRLLCVLMVMVMVVLMVPAIAGADEIPRAVPIEGGTVSGNVTWEPGSHFITLNNLNAQANSGYKFERWELIVEVEIEGSLKPLPPLMSSKPQWNSIIEVWDDIHSIVSVTAIFEPAEPEPEPTNPLDQKYELLQSKLDELSSTVEGFAGRISEVEDLIKGLGNRVAKPKDEDFGNNARNLETNEEYANTTDNILNRPGMGGVYHK